MKTRWIVLAALLLLLSAPGCFESRNEVIEKESLGYFRFTGNLQGAVVDATKDGQAVLTGLVPEEKTNYSVRPGVYRLTVTRGGMKVVERKLFVVDGQVLEVRIP